MIDYAKLDTAADGWRERFHEASPFPHLVIDGLFDANLAAEIGAAFPPVRAGFRSHRHLHSDKYSVQDEAQFPPVVRMAMDELHGPRFLAWLERATGMAGLEPDPHRFGEGMHASGPGGFLDVQGKKFEIESGTVTFTGAPNNPTAEITAGWSAPEGTRVYADFVGPIKTGKVNLRSEPARSKSEIFAIIMYGSDQDASEGQGQAADTTTQMAGMGGGLATQGLNKAIRGLTGSDFATVRVDTSSSANPRPEIEFQIARRISLQLATVFGQLPLDRPDRNFASINWRFKRNWSAQTTVGDQGSSTVDLIWQRRY